MTVPTFPLTQGDTLPIVTSTLTDGTGATIDLTGGTVRFRMRASDGTSLKVNSTATIDLPLTDGKVRYAWQAADTDTPGVYFAEWRVTYGTAQITVPNEQPIVVLTRPRLEDLPLVDPKVVSEIRARIGSASPPTDTDLMLSYQTLGTVDQVVLLIKEQRFAEAMAKPAKYTIEGDSSFDYSANLAAMQKELNAQRARTSGGMTTGRLVAEWPR